MPRKKFEPGHDVEHLSILDEKGKLDSRLEPEIDDELLLKMHRTMLFSRRFDEALLKWQRQGRIGTFAPVSGQEAAQVGSAAVLEEEDWMVPAFREFAAAVWRGTPPVGLLLYTAGYNEGGAIPEEQHDLPIAIPVASQLVHAVGIAYGIKYREREQVVLTYFGDGATSEGDFHEAMNMAAVFSTPIVFVCQNNQWAISVPREKQARSRTLAQRALAYGMPGIQVDGNDLLAVYVATQEAVERARAGKGPTLIECVTYRLSVHTTADDPGKYRSEKEVKKWEKRDPIPRFQNYLGNKNLLSKDEIEKLEKEIKEEIQGVWHETEKQMERLGDPMDMFEYVFHEMPPYLEEQRDAYAEFLKERKENHDG